MAQGTFYKTFGSSDRTTTRTLLHESIPITASIVSGTYADENIRTYTHGMFQSVYDYPFLSSSANHIFDITVGIKSGSANYESLTSQKEKKGNVYSQMSQVLMGYDTSGTARSLDQDGDLSGGETMEDVVFLNFSRLVSKDEIKKGSFSMKFGINEAYSNAGAYSDTVLITDSSGSNGYFVNSPAGEYGLLHASPRLASGSTNFTVGNSMGDKVIGLIFYQAGIVALSSSLFISNTGSAGIAPKGLAFDAQTGVANDLKYGVISGGVSTGNDSMFKNLLEDQTIGTIADGIRNRIQTIQFNNTTELNSTIYFCRANHNEFNYSSNPTYLSGSKIRVKNNDIMVPPRSYVTTVGLYSSDNELLAVAKLSEPLRKDPTNELTLRVRLDY